MKIVIWGAGVRGRRLMHFLGNDKVEAFVDSRPEIQNTLYEGVPIISFEKYLDSYSECYVVITPILSKERIVFELEKANVSRFMLLSDCPDNFYDYKYGELMYKTLNGMEESTVILYGINLYSLLLVDFLKKNGKETVLIPAINDSGIMHSDLVSDGYEINMLDNANVVTNSVWLTSEITGDDYAEIEKNNFVCKSAFDFRGLVPGGGNNKLRMFKDRHKGKRCFVVATGPSLRMSDLDKLAVANEICISMNGIYHAFDKTKWRPNYFVVSDKSAHLLADHIDSIDVEYKFVSDQSEEYWSEKHPVNVYKFHTRFCERELKFSDDFSVGTYTAGAVTYNCIQLAYYLGCTEIYLLGTDCSFNGYNRGGNAHFTKDYVFDDSLRKGKSTPITYVYTENEQFLAQIRTYKAAKRFADDNGVKIFNATRGGELEVFERVDFDDLF